VKRKVLEKQIIKIFKTVNVKISFKEGANHSKLYLNGKYFTAIPRHKEIAELLAKAILKEVKNKVKELNKND
jgi:hypothetical protein